MPTAKVLREVPLAAVRRLAIESQGLGRERAAGSRDGLLELVFRMGCLQIDPISVVAPTQELVLWARTGGFDRTALDDLLWRDRSLFHYWAHAASIVPTGDYPIHALLMRRWARGDTKYERRVREWIRVNARLRRSIAGQLRAEGPLKLADLRRVPAQPWQSSGWNDAQDAARMIEFLWLKGVVTIAGRAGGARLWDLMDEWLPHWTPRETWSERRVVEAATLRSLRALGVATLRHVKEHFTRSRYPALPDVLARLVRRGEVEEVAVAGDTRRLPGRWYVHAADVPRLEALSDGSWEGSCRLLSPFDNLICDRARTELLWRFEYRIEIYVPKAKRRYGYYVLPVLWHDRLVGRMDAAFDKAAGVLRVLSVHAEPRSPPRPEGRSQPRSRTWRRSSGRPRSSGRRACPGPGRRRFEGGDGRAPAEWVSGMRSRGWKAAVVCAALVAAIAAAPAAGAGPARGSAGPHAVVALIDTGINPYSPAFRDGSPLARRHPSTYLPGYPKDAVALRLTLDTPYEEAVERDEEVWRSVRSGVLYWIPGTRIVGAVSLGAGGTSCPSPVQVPPVGAFLQGQCAEHKILDDHGHGSMTASRAAGAPSSLAPGARIVAIEGLGARSVDWAADQGWIDVQSNSWISLVPPPAPSGVTESFSRAAQKMLTLAASGNGTAYLAGVAPTPTYLLSTAPPGVVLVGGHDNGKATLWSGSPPHVVADAYAGMTAIARSLDEMRPDPIACCTSAASPYAAGGAIAVIAEARRLLGAKGTGVHGGVVACGPAGRVAGGPLADGVFTLDELKDVFLHTAEALPSEGRDDGDVHWAGDPRAPDHPEYGPGANPFCVGCTTTPLPWKTLPAAGDAYALVGYGGINEHSVEAAVAVLRGEEDMAARPLADAQYEADQDARAAFFGANDLSTPEEPATTCAGTAVKGAP